MFLYILVVGIIGLAILDGFVRETTEYDDFSEEEHRYATVISQSEGAKGKVGR